MESQTKTHAMSRKIFDTGFSVETISVYLLCCGLDDSGASISTKNLRGIWNSELKSLEQSLSQLEENNILRKIISDQEKNRIYRLTDHSDWKI